MLRRSFLSAIPLLCVPEIIKPVKYPALRKLLSAMPEIVRTLKEYPSTFNTDDKVYVDVVAGYQFLILRHEEFYSEAWISIFGDTVSFHVSYAICTGGCSDALHDEIRELHQRVVQTGFSALPDDLCLQVLNVGEDGIALTFQLEKIFPHGLDVQNYSV